MSSALNGVPIDYPKQVAILRKALAEYANQKNWRNDDWNVPAIFEPDYGKPGQKARNALKRAGLS